MADPLTGTATPFYHSDSLIIATAGSFRHQMFCYPGPRASYAVFVGPSNPLNDAETPLLAPTGTFLSLQRGDLTGAIVALKTIVHILEKGLTPYGPLRRAIIKTDSEIGCGESRIRDWDLWEAILVLLDIVKRLWNVEVLFWWVPAKWNRDAKSLAAEGLKLPPPRSFQDRRERRAEMTSSESLESRY
ncbi:hypothetical protein UCDDA912_g09643 [Diaporthe ampelina]|uniref:RNase H type-1 domain-containing protein n=1 Tax=Diaporthe ampelina TaxID=1214573 RepID=A0A0G2H5A3_9PEZI|nr:hypothetical protein UCDDA912_g09643 [Diaporthe ampelina]